MRRSGTQRGKTSFMYVFEHLSAKHSEQSVFIKFIDKERFFCELKSVTSRIMIEFLKCAPRKSCTIKKEIFRHFFYCFV